MLAIGILPSCVAVRFIMTARPNPVVNCPLTATWAAVGGKWKLTIIYWLGEQPRHFAALKRQLDAVSEGVSQKVLAQQLRELMGDGIVARESTGAAPAPVIYSLTEYGTTVLPMLEMVRLWGLAHIARTQTDGAPSCVVNRHPQAPRAPAQQAPDVAFPMQAMRG
jgi:DNA-binding HxlR family transcriptional regulator